jgi:site-specific DNA recombinase
MIGADNRVVRCAVYTRVSTDAGLDQEFNSLDAQYDASKAYIRSQAHAGWTLVKNRYDDGGFSGGSTDRPALQQLLADVAARKVHVIVVYKVDRLTRSLADFAKLVELFDAHGVSFVSVTQQFNTTTSMGRLTLNVLLSFAQFEREVTSERIRDKIAASKRKGLWVGGNVALGYALKDGKLVIDETDAETVRFIFQRYLEVSGVNSLARDLKTRGMVSKLKHLSTGGTRGGVPFTQGPLFYMLRNPFYVGIVKFKKEILPGPQPRLLDQELFDAVQSKLSSQWSHRTTTRLKTQALLTGLLFDDAGQPMVSTHATKNRVRYRYYVSASCLRGPANEPAGSVKRVAAKDIELAVAQALMEDAGNRLEQADLPEFTREMLDRLVARVEVRKSQLAIHLKSVDTHRREALDADLDKDDFGSPPAKQKMLLVPWKKASIAREIICPRGDPDQRKKPIKAGTRVELIRSIGLGRLWLRKILDDGLSAADIAADHGCGVRMVNMTISLAFLSPTIVTAAVGGRLPRGLSVRTLKDPQAEWSLQLNRLGLTSPVPL